MVPDDIERFAQSLERSARYYVHAAAHEVDEAVRHRRLADLSDRWQSDHAGHAAGLAFRAQELRYDARGGMTAATERRRFRLDARWSLDGVVCQVASYAWREDATHVVRLCPENASHTFNEDALDMTRSNGWVFLGLSDQGGYR